MVLLLEPQKRKRWGKGNKIKTQQGRTDFHSQHMVAETGDQKFKITLSYEFEAILGYMRPYLKEKRLGNRPKSSYNRKVGFCKLC